MKNIIFILLCMPLTSFGQNSEALTKINKFLASKNIEYQSVKITDQYTSGGITHIYFKEEINGIPIYNSRGAIHFKDQNNLVGNVNFITRKLIPRNSISTKGIAEAIKDLSAKIGIDKPGQITLINADSLKKTFVFSAPHISSQDILTSQQYFFDDKHLSLVWTIAIEDIRTGHYTNYIVDANRGNIIKEVSWTVECTHGKPHEHMDCDHPKEKNSFPVVNKSEAVMMPNSYKVYAWPVESPNFGDSSVVTSPWNDNLVASPNGWHTIGNTDFTHSVGNNTDTYLDNDDTNSPTGGNDARADGGANLEFRFPLDLSGSPENYVDAAITNTFYWTNIMHDVWYNYGFDEVSGNFQEENFTNNGQGSDYVNSEVQDGSGTCNANFSTPPDGLNPRMQMYLCNGRDGDYDNGVIAHEYGHGISIRLTGGPGTSGCLNNSEQMGEGWSDYFGMVMTIENGDSGPDSRGMGTWLFGQGPDGAGIRPFPYSTDFNINPMTYGTLPQNNISVPHGVGSVWCTMLWDMTWAFIDEYGFDPDIYNGVGGNNMAMALVIEGLKLQPCSPGFVDGRDAILLADEMLNNGANKCIIWEAFANRGLGYSANQGSTNNKSDGVEAFDMPPVCNLALEKSTSTLTATKGTDITYKIKTTNNTEGDLTDILVTDIIPNEMSFVSATENGTESNGIVSWPLFDLAVGASDSVEVVLQVKNDINDVLSDIYDSMESGTAQWDITNSGSTSWALQTDQVNTGSFAWFAPDNNTTGLATFDLAFSVGLGDAAELIFSHNYDTEVQWDGGRVFISTDEGSSWIDLGPNMTENGYNNTVFNSIPGFSGNSNGWIQTTIDLSSFSGQNVRVRFQMDCDAAVGGNGWWIDDILLLDLFPFVFNTSQATDGDLLTTAASNITKIEPSANSLTAELTVTDIVCEDGDNGSISTIVSGGTGNYTYLWDDGNTDSDRTDLSAGIYIITVSDGISEVVKVGNIKPDLNPINITVNSSNVTDPVMDNGTASVIITGGQNPYNILWSNGETTTTINNLSAGTYTVTVTDNNLCTKITSTDIIDPFEDCDDNLFLLEIQLDQYPEDISYTIVDDMDNELDSEPIATFEALSEGALFSKSLCVPDGCFTIQINDAFGDGLCANYSSPQGFVKITDLISNQVLVDVCDFADGTDELFCINVTSDMTIDPVVNDVSCSGTNDGSVTSLGVQGNNGPISYLWSNGATTEDIANLESGLYTVTITDDIGSITEVITILGAAYSTVTTVDDFETGSLRDVIENGCPTDTILVDITLLNGIFFIDDSPINVAGNKVIIGLGINEMIIDGNDENRIFDITPGAYLHAQNLTLQNTFEPTNGGAFFNQGEVVLENIRLRNNIQNNVSKAWSNTSTSSTIIRENVIIEE